MVKSAQTTHILLIDRQLRLPSRNARTNYLAYMRSMFLTMIVYEAIDVNTSFQFELFLIFIVIVRKYTPL